MADAVILGDREVVNAGLLAKPVFGGYAVKALLHPKRRLAIPHWRSTLRTPTEPTMGISRRYFTQAYDQATSELASKMAEMHGRITSIPRAASRIERVPPDGWLAALGAWDGGARLQVLKTAALSGGCRCVHPPDRCCRCRT